jgi:hypothetical protein
MSPEDEDRDDDQASEDGEDRDPDRAREPGEKIKQAEPEEQAEHEVEEDIDRAFE